jgi:hypothetical protein
VNEALTLESVTERDVDLLLVEELKCSEGFRDWFLSHLATTLERTPWRTLSSFRVRHSVSGVGKHAGETDIGEWRGTLPIFLSDVKARHEKMVSLVETMQMVADG